MRVSKQNAKITVKIQDSNRKLWVHFCYVPNDLKIDFDMIVNKDYSQTNFWIEKWSQENFSKPFENTYRGLFSLKKDIKRMYSEKYPELYTGDNCTVDSQGWLRVWYQNHMKKEIEHAKQLSR